MKRKIRALPIAVVMGLSIVGCAGGVNGGAGEPAADTEPQSAPDTGEEQDLEVNVAFFGFAQANNFAHGTFNGVRQAAEAAGGEATFFDGQFDAQVQIAQMQDAITGGAYNIFVVQANDGGALVPVVEEALEAGIVVVAEFTPIGTAYDTLEPQVDGMIFAGDVITENGVALAELGIRACADLDPCKVAYLQGFQLLPLDNARTDAVLARFEEEPSIEVVATPEGGYTPEQGLQATQDILLAHPDVNVIIGSSQAIAGAEQGVEQAGEVAGVDVVTGEIALVANGGSTQAVTAVQEGRWFGAYVTPAQESGRKATELGIARLRGEGIPMGFDTTQLGPGAATAAELDGYTADYDD